MHSIIIHSTPRLCFLHRQKYPILTFVRTTHLPRPRTVHMPYGTYARLLSRQGPIYRAYHASFLCEPHECHACTTFILRFYMVLRRGPCLSCWSHLGCLWVPRCRPVPRRTGRGRGLAITRRLRWYRFISLYQKWRIFVFGENCHKDGSF
jgi:hypothetical protein